MNSRMRAIGRLFVGNLLGSVFRFPFWWYTTGLEQLARQLMRRLRFRIGEYGFAIWMKNFFVFSIEAVFSLVVLCVWILAPIVCAFLLVSNLTHGVSSVLYG